MSWRNVVKEFDTQLPNASVIRAAMRETTNRLAAELAAPTDSAPEWNGFEWRVAMAVSVMHGISGLLAGRLRWRGEPAWQSFLADQLTHSRQREQHTRTLLARLDTAAREARVALVALKGSALLELGIYKPGERPMSDVDLLVRPTEFDAANALILNLGFAAGVSSWKHRDYLPLDTPAERGFGEHADNPVKIELHARLPERLPVREIDIAAQVFPDDAGTGLNAYPSIAALMRHLLLHAAGNLCGGAIRLIQIHDIAALAARLTDADWQEALAEASDGLPAWWAAPPFALAQRLFPDHIPTTPCAMKRAVSACPPFLRASLGRQDLNDVSASRFAIRMLPGLAWSHTTAEAWACARQRLLPDREAEATTRLQVQSHHAHASSAWTHQPRWLKALRFLGGAPPRVQAIYNLHGALAYRPSSSA